MNWLDSLTIHRFRGLQEVTLPELGRINLLVGANNSGKTSVLEAIATYCQPLDALAWLRTAGRREVERFNLPRLDALKWLFPQAAGSEPGSGGYRGETRVSGSGRYKVRENHALFGENEGTRAVEPADRVERANIENILTDLGDEKNGITAKLEVLRRQIGEHQPSIPDENLAEKRRNIEFLEEELKEIQELHASWHGKLELLRTSGISMETRQGAKLSLTVTTAKNDSAKLERSYQLWEDESVIRPRGIIQPSLPVATITPFAHRVEQLQIQQLSDATMKGFKDAVLDVIRRIDPQVQDLEILSPQGNRASLYIRHEKVGLAPLTAFGDGIRRTLMYALILPTVAHGVLLIDELEAAIHVSALGRVFGWLVDACKSYDVQLFATTHSLEALDAILEAGRAEQDQIVGFHLDEAQRSAPVKRYSGELLRRLRHERGLDVR